MRLRTDLVTLDVLRYIFGSRIEDGSEEADGRVEVALRAQSELMVARQLAGFADALEVPRRRASAGTWPTSAAAWYAPTR